jgi:hypothetical protein
MKVMSFFISEIIASLSKILRDWWRVRSLPFYWNQILNGSVNVSCGEGLGEITETPIEKGWVAKSAVFTAGSQNVLVFEAGTKTVANIDSVSIKKSSY